MGGYVEIGDLLLRSFVDAEVVSGTVLMHDWALMYIRGHDLSSLAAPKFFSGASSRATRRARGIVTIAEPAVVDDHVLLRCVQRQMRHYLSVLRVGHVIGVSVAGTVCTVRVVEVRKEDCELRVVLQGKQQRALSAVEIALELCFGELLSGRLSAMKDGHECRLVVVGGRGMCLDLLMSVLAGRLGLGFFVLDVQSEEDFPLQGECVVFVRGLEQLEDSGALRNWMQGAFARKQIPVLVCTSLGLLPADLRSGSVAISVRPPDSERRRILLQAFGETPDQETVDSTGGFSVTDLQRLVEAFRVTQSWSSARQHVQPQLLSEVCSVVAFPNLSWKDVVGCDNVKRALERGILWPLRHPELMSQFGLKMAGGILLYGPSGCGKSLCVAAFAASCKINLVQTSASQLTSKYTGETESLIRSLFASCRAVAPCVLALDNFDQLASSREADVEEDTGGALQRAVSTLLNELDGLDTGGAASGGIFFVALSNRPWLLDSAILRPGRIDTMM
jgi:hypothetical protein